MADKDSTDFDVLLFVVQKIMVLLVTTGLCARVRYGTLAFEFKIHDGKVTHTRPKIEFDIRAEKTE